MYTKVAKEPSPAGRSVSQELTGSAGVSQMSRPYLAGTVQRITIEELDDHDQPINSITISPELQLFMAHFDQAHFNAFASATDLLTEHVSRDSYADGYADRAPDRTIGEIFRTLNGMGFDIRFTADRLRRAWEEHDYATAETNYQRLRRLVETVKAAYRRWIAWKGHLQDPGPFFDPGDDDDNNPPPPGSGKKSDKGGKKAEKKDKGSSSGMGQDEGLQFDLEF